MPKNTACKDIARQLVEDEPGKNIRVNREWLMYFDDSTSFNYENNAFIVL